MAKKPEAKTFMEKTTISKITRTVPRHEGFHFFRELGEPTGKVATSLADFADKMRSVDIRSVNFHFKRHDFQKWIRDSIGDAELSTKISRLRKEAHGEKLRNEIVKIVKERLEELKGTQTKA